MPAETTETSSTPAAAPSSEGSTDTSATSAESTETGGEGGDPGGEVEAPKPEPKPEPKPDPMGPRFAALTKKEKAIVERDKELSAREQSLAAREADVAHLAKAKAAADANDFDAVLEHLGAMKDDTALTKFMQGINGVVLRKKDLPPEVIEMGRKLRSLEDERAAEKKAEAEAAEKTKQEALAAQQQQATQAKLGFFEHGIAPYIKANAEKLEVVNYALSDAEFAPAVFESIFDKIATERARIEKEESRAFTLEADLPKALAKATEEVETEVATKFGAEIAKLSALKKLQPKKEAKKEPQTREERHEAVLSQITTGHTASPRPRTLTTSVQQAPPRGEEGDSSDPKVAFANALKLL